MIVATATDPTGNTGPQAATTVDAVAPPAPVIDPSNGTTISGTAEAGAKVILTDGNGNPIGETKQGDRQVVGHALLVVGEQDVAAGGEVGLFHQLLQVLDRFVAEADEVAAAVQVLAEPAAERVGAGLVVEEAPGLVLGVVAFVEVGQQRLPMNSSSQRRTVRSTWGRNSGRASSSVTRIGLKPSASWSAQASLGVMCRRRPVFGSTMRGKLLCGRSLYSAICCSQNATKDSQGFLGKGLSLRELQCVLGIAAGRTSKELARDLGMQPGTVGKRVLAATTKLGVTRRAALVAEAMRRGLISPAVIALAFLVAGQPLLNDGRKGSQSASSSSNSTTSNASFPSPTTKVNFRSL